MLEEERGQRAAAVRRASHAPGSKLRAGSALQQQPGQQPAKRPAPTQPTAQQEQPEPEQQPAQAQRQPTPPDSLSFDAGGTGGLLPSSDSSVATDCGEPSSGAGEGADSSTAPVGRTDAELIDDDKLRRASNVARRMSESSAPRRPFHMQQAEQQAGRPVPRCQIAATRAAVQDTVVGHHRHVAPARCPAIRPAAGVGSTPSTRTLGHPALACATVLTPAVATCARLAVVQVGAGDPARRQPQPERRRCTAPAGAGPCRPPRAHHRAHRADAIHQRAVHQHGAQQRLRCGCAAGEACHHRLQQWREAAICMCLTIRRHSTCQETPETCQQWTHKKPGS